MIDRVLAVIGEQLVKALEDLDRLEPGTKQYAECLEYISNLIEKEKEVQELKDARSPRTKIIKFLSNPAIIAVIGNLLGIVLILNYERASIITSKAYSFIRPR